MLAADRVFLEDFRSLAFKNHMMASIALFAAGGDAKRNAARYLRLENQSLTEAEAEAQEKTQNEHVRFQSTMSAKLFAELVAAIEDCGALYHAIRHRGGSGILDAYFGAPVGAVGNFFDYVLANPRDDLGRLFRLPELSAISSKVDAKLFDAIKGHYSDAPKHIAQIAAIYRTPPGVIVHDLAALPPDWQTKAFVLVDVPGSSVSSAKDVVPHAYNKIKHGFMVIDSPDEYAKLPNAADFKVVTIDKEGPRIKDLIDATRTVSMGAVEMASVLLALDDVGVAF